MLARHIRGKIRSITMGILEMLYSNFMTRDYTLMSSGTPFPSSLSFRLHHLIDRFGAAGSLLCAVHCALLPLALALVPSLGLAFLMRDGVELAVVVFVTGLGLSSLWMGYRRHHVLRALLLLGLGLGALWAGLLYPPLHHSRVPHAVVMTLGGVLVALAHLLNLHLNHRHAHGPHCAH